MPRPMKKHTTVQTTVCLDHSLWYAAKEAMLAHSTNMKRLVHEGLRMRLDQLARARAKR